MKNSIIYILATLFCITLLTSCYKDENIEGQISDEFYLRHEGADLPIWVKGNSESDTYIVFLHGGPFQTAIEESVYGNFDQLHEDYVMVYFDQRGGGFTHGQIAANLSEEQFVEDLQVVTELIKEKYPKAKNLYLMGHSWGGYLGTSYLASENYQENYNGWIELAGTHNFPLTWETSRDFCKNYINENFPSNHSAYNLWQERLSVLNETPTVSTYEEVLKINGVAHHIQLDINGQNNNLDSPSWFYLQTSPVGTQYDQKNNYLMEDMLVNGNLNDKMHHITIPSLLIYGKKDAIVTTAIGENAMLHLGTPDEDKTLHIFEESDHTVFSVEIERFFTTVTDFIEKYNK